MHNILEKILQLMDRKGKMMALINLRLEGTERR